MKFSALLQYVTPHRRTLLAIVALLLAESALSLASPWLAGQLTGAVLGQSDIPFGSIRTLLAVWLALMVANSLLGFLSSYLVGRTGAAMGAQLRSRVYEHLQILPLPYHQDRRQGELLSMLSSDSEVISDFVTNTLVQLLPLIVTFLGAFAIMAWLDPSIAILAAVLMPLYYVTMKLIGRRIRPITEAWVVAWSGVTTLVMENLGLMPAIKAFGREPLEKQRFKERNENLLGWSRKQILIQSLLSPAIGLLAGAGLLLMLWVGLAHIEAGKLAPAQLVSLLLYAAMLTRPVSGLANVYGKVLLTRGAAKRLLEFFSVRPEPLDDTSRRLAGVKGKIEFREVNFAYPGRPAVLKGFNLVITAGETIALTGPNGAGKSTLAHLLLRFMEPSGGSILIDDQDIRQVSLSSLRDQIGLVAQNTLLLNGTVAENIGYGRQHAGMEDIKKAAKAARADAFIEALPDGYGTLIGDQGIRLSGGQRQRLSLARTLLKDPPILILDEATAMFDPEGEKSFISECHELLRLRTVILITHRPASLALADRVLHMEPGCDQLLRKSQP